MEKLERENLVKKIVENEQLRKISRIQRLLKKPFKTLPYYFLASIARIRPFIVSFKTLWGDDFTSDLPNGNTFLYFGYAEANLTNFLLKNIKQDQTFIDGGANTGFYSLLASNLVGSNGSVHSFEPTPSTFKLLETNTKNKINIKINNLALIDEKKEIDFIDYGIGYNAFNSIHIRDNKIKEIRGKDHKIKVQAIDLDSYCEIENIKPDFIKLDLEGSEYIAIQGMGRVLENYKPILSVEVVGDDEWIKYIRKTNDFLTSLGYIPFIIETDGSTQEHSLQNSYKYDNLIYIHKDKLNNDYN